jgi:NAD(P)-dependent dehydrogenase (short-subunit alcohol dehydrogenase family)
VLVVGASRGIGAELARQYRASGWAVRATVRDPASPGEMADLEGVRLHRLEVRDDAEVAALVADVPPRSLDVVIHNAGVYRGFSRDELMAINADAPIELADALVGAERVAPGGKLVLVTSQMGARRGRTGSLGDYGDSKEALNLAFRERADGWAQWGVIAVVVHPGWVRTDMGGQGAAIGVDESASGMRRLIAGLGSDDHGRFWTWDGREHLW